MCGLVGSDVDQGRSWGLRGQTIKRSGDALCGPHHTCGGDEKRGFLGLVSKPRFTVSSGLASKPTATVSSGLSSKPAAMVAQFGHKTSRYGFLWFGLKTTCSVSQFGSQNRRLWFGDLGLKITAMVSWFGPQNQVGYGLSVSPQIRCEDEDGAGHVSGSSGLLRLEVSSARVF
jgi:hypothetical protein